MGAYAEAYLSDVVENQGKLFDYVAETFPDKDTEDFINFYMQSNTRKTLWEYFCKTEEYALKDGKALAGFLPDWVGEFYAYYQWFYNIPSREVVKKIPLSFLKKAYPGLHDLELDLAVQKVGESE